MKRFVLWLHDSRNSILVDLILMAVITVAIYMVSNAIGIYRYEAMAYDNIRYSIESESAVYYMEYFEPSSYLENSNPYTSNLEQLNWIDKLKKMPGVRAIYNSPEFKLKYYGERKTVQICSDDLREFYPQLNEGEWFDTAVNEDGSLNAVIADKEFWGCKVGDLLTLTAGSEEVTIKICGMLYEPSLIPTFSGSGTSVEAESIYSTESTFIIGESDMAYKLFRGNISGAPILNNMFIDFNEEATEEEIQAVYKELETKGGYSNINEIKKNSREYLGKVVVNDMVLPIFYMVIAFVAFLSIMILCVLKKTHSYSVYYLLGFSKERITLDIVGRISILVGIAALINIAYVMNYYRLVMMEIVSTDMYVYYFDNTSVGIIIFLASAILGATIWAVTRVLKHKSPTEFWREVKE